MGALPPNQKFILQMCKKLPETTLVNGKRADFAQDLISKTFSIKTCSKTAIDLNATCGTGVDAAPAVSAKIFLIRSIGGERKTEKYFG